MRTTPRMLSLIFFCTLTIYLLVFQIRAIWEFTVDDMYITLRYAHQWGLSSAPLWNIGEPPVEGYSNFSFVLIARFFQWLHLDPVWGLKTLGIGSLVCLCFGLFLLTREIAGATYAMIPVIWLLTYRGQIIWTASGLETTFYECTLVFSVYYLLKSLKDRKPQDTFRVGFLFSLLGITRPEGGWLALLYLVMYCSYTFRQANFKRLCLYLWVSFGVIYLPYFAWRWSYFGYLFPNSVYCKGAAHEFIGLLDLRYLRLAWPFLCCTIPLLWMARYRHIYLFFILPTVFYLVCCGMSDPIVAFDNRLFLPALALLFSLATAGLSQMIAQPVWVYFFSALLWLIAVPKMSLQEYQSFTKNPLAGERLRKDLSHWLSSRAKPQELVVLGDSGLIPYHHPELNFIDSYCLNNLTMGHLAAHKRYTQFCETILTRRPHYIILTAWIHDNQVEYAPADACLSELLPKTEAYELLNVFRSYSADHTIYQYMLFGLKST